MKSGCHTRSNVAEKILLYESRSSKMLGSYYTSQSSCGGLRNGDLTEMHKSGSCQSTSKLRCLKLACDFAGSLKNDHLPVNSRSNAEWKNYSNDSYSESVTVSGRTCYGRVKDCRSPPEYKSYSGRISPNNNEKVGTMGHGSNIRGKVGTMLDFRISKNEDRDYQVEDSCEDDDEEDEVGEESSCSGWDDCHETSPDEDVLNQLRKHQDEINNNANPSNCSHTSSSSDEVDANLDRYKSESESDGERSNAGEESTSYESESSSDFLYCREECNNNQGWDQRLNSSTSSSEEVEKKWRFSTSKSSTSCESILSNESIVSTSRYGSVKRSSRALADDDGTLYPQSSCIKRFRSNEGLAVTPPGRDDNCYYSRSSSESTSPLGASSYTTEATIYTSLSPNAGYEAETQGSVAEATLPEGHHYSEPNYTSEYIPECDWAPQAKVSLPDEHEAENNYFPDNSGDDELFGMFRCPNNPLPFQLHPIHHEDLDEYYSIMREKELISHPSNCLRDQEKIRHTMRHILVEWLTKIAHHYKLNGESIHLTVNILDRYTERQKGIYRGHYQLLGVTSLLVATKQLEVDIPPVTTCLMLCRNLYSKAQLLSLERHLLDILRFDLNVPTASTFLDYYIISKYIEFPRLGLENVITTHQTSKKSSYLKNLLCVSRCLLDFGLAEYNFSQYLPSTAARASMMLAEEVIHEPESHTEWNEYENQQKHYVPYGSDSYQPHFKYGCEAGYVDPEMVRFQNYDGRSCMPRWRRFRAPLSHGNARKCHQDAELDVGLDVGDIVECCDVLRSVVGDKELRNIRDTLDKIVIKYSFE